VIACPPGPPDEFGPKRLLRMSRDPLAFFTQLRRDHGRFVHYGMPLRFDPLRFEPARKARRHRFAYFPFGGGPRLCIGDGFAWLAGTLLLATLAQRWRFELLPGQRIAPQPRVTLRLKNGLQLVPRARRASHARLSQPS
jgi:cytochrome P450